MGLNIAVTSKYKPFTYEDYIKPLEKYFENYEKHETALETLGTTAESLSYIIDAEPEGSPLRQKYENYKTQLQAAVDALADGYNAKDRELLSNLKKTFKRDLEPIGTGYKRRQDMIDEQRKFKTTHPSIVYSNDASNASVWDFVDNPTWSYNSFIGDNLTKQVQEMVSPLAQIIQKAVEGDDIGKYDTILKRYGATPQDVLTYIENGTGELAKYFKFAEDSVVRASGVLEWDDKDDAFLNKAYDFTKLGLPKAIGKSDIIPITGSKSGNDDGSSANGMYPGSSYRIGTTIAYNSENKEEYEKKEKEFKSLAQDHKGILHTSKELKLLGKFQKYGITTENIDKYEKYLKSIADANAKHLKSTVNLAAAGLHTYVDNPNIEAEAIRNAKGNELFREVEKHIALKDIKEYRDEVTKAGVLAAEGMRPKAPKTGSTDQMTIYGGETFAEDARRAIALQHRQAATDIAILDPTWTEGTHNNDVLRRLKKDYDYMTKEKDGNGLYQIDLSDGTREWVKEEEAKKILADKENTSIAYTIQHGMLINNDGNYYILEGSKIAGPSRDVVHIYNSLRNFSRDAINDYQDATKRDAYLVYNVYPNETNAFELFKKLASNNALAVDSKNNKNNLYAYIQVRYSTPEGEKVNDLVKVLYDRSGVFLGLSSVNSELGQNPASAQYALDRMRPAIYRTPNELTNKSTSPASPLKGANPQLPY